MTVTISDKGALTISPENQLESYALGKWVENYLKGDKESVLIIQIE